MMNRRILDVVAVLVCCGFLTSCIATGGRTGNPPEGKAVETAKAFLAAQPQAKDYLLDSYRVQETPQSWDVFFKHVERTRRPDVCLIRVSKETGEAKWIPMR